MPKFKTTNALLTWAAVGAALACAVAAAHYRVLFLNETFVLRDAIRFISPPAICSHALLPPAESQSGLTARVSEWLLPPIP